MRSTGWVVASLAILLLSGCVLQPTTLAPLTLTPSASETPIPFDIVESPMGTPIPSSPVASLATTEPPPTPTHEPTVTKRDISPDLPLDANEFPGPYSLYLDSFTIRSNESIASDPASDSSTLQFLEESGRVTGSVSVFYPETSGAATPDSLMIHLTIFTSVEGPDQLLQRDGGPCRPDNPRYMLFRLEDNDLGLGDQSALCSDGATLWYRFGYRNTYFDIVATGDAATIDRDWLLRVAEAQLAKLQSMPLYASSGPTATATLTPTLLPSPTVPSTITDGPTWITEADKGKALRYPTWVRFGISLDPSQYSRHHLDISQCPFMGEVSNWSLNGPQSFPVGFEGGEGSCIVSVGEFWIHIVITDDP